VPGETLKFTGTSVVVNPKGEYLLKAGDVEEGCRVVEINPADADNKMATPRNDLLKDRRVELYGALLDKGG
jgi:predicted amidohydrolase